MEWESKRQAESASQGGQSLSQGVQGSGLQNAPIPGDTVLIWQFSWGVCGTCRWTWRMRSALRRDAAIM